jgi:hypothetical protein
MGIQCLSTGARLNSQEYFASYIYNNILIDNILQKKTFIMCTLHKIIMVNPSLISCHLYQQSVALSFINHNNKKKVLSKTSHKDLMQKKLLMLK